MAVLKVRNLVKSYRSPDEAEQRVVDVAAFEMADGSELALRGESGSGKTTFLNLLSGILRPDSGSIELAGREITSLDERAMDRFRAAHIGYIFQTFNLLQGFTCLENVLLAMSFAGSPRPEDAREMLNRVGLGQRADYFPRQLSTGQQQRVAVARALVNRPRLVLADEPTGNLDRANAKAALGLIRQICREQGAALLLVSHDPEVLGEFAARSEFSSINASGAAPAV